ncbi:FKBP-type peptidyl-prolyl cis-trans isomerase [Pedobacter frigiditerrae]|uniref:FKBP-type peptidyl-prolyl cis-trans isomerase n=1 Tax=Pedobacter frigiditerrae TaxID=2530452 RepID=UPI00292D2864|nr:FKBP-type peptidyl-prolyl cis-trans isomerase [Pedobacter frigiditerrae]
MRKLTTYTLALVGMLILFNSCKKEYETIESIDDAKIQAYIKKNNLTMTKDPSGFYYQTVSQGTGAPLLNKDSVLYNLSIGSLAGANYYTTAAYTNEGTYLGYISPSSYRTALEGVNRGAKVRVILPSYLAYGKNGNATVPSNEVIISDITTDILPTQWQIDDKRIIDFLAAKGLTATKSPLRVYYIVKTAGTGTSVDISSTITVKYTGRTLNGNVFDTSGDNTIVSPLMSLIKGWEVLLGMQKGAKVRIFVPSDLGYGLSAQTNIPGSSVLDFDIELVDVTN